MTSENDMCMDRCAQSRVYLAADPLSTRRIGLMHSSQGRRVRIRLPANIAGASTMQHHSRDAIVCDCICVTNTTPSMNHHVHVGC